MIIEKEIRHGHLFCGLGGGAKGFNKGKARVKNLEAKFRCIGGIDNDPGALRNFEKLAGVRGTLLDLFSREQYIAFHQCEPPPGWQQAMPDDIRAAFGYERPHIIFLSAPCKGFSGLLAEKQSKTAKYQALNGLTLRGVWLALEAYKDDPVELFIFENVPRIQTRGRALLDQIIALLRHYGYAVAETTHDCGELGGLGQSRKRFLLVARHQGKVPAFLYEPPKKRLKGIGEILETLPLPGLGLGGPMHRLPALQWKTWVRLAFVKAGSDWRSLNTLAVENGVLKDYGIVPTEPLFNEAYNVKRWSDKGATVTSKNQPSSSQSVADPRIEGEQLRGRLGVKGWDDTGNTVGGEAWPTNGSYSVADPRVDGHPKSVQLGVREWDQTGPVVNGQMQVGGGPHSVADPRVEENTFKGLSLKEWQDTAGAITTQRSPGSSAQSVADPRITDRTPFSQAYRIVEWEQPGTAVTAARGALAAVADPRPEKQPNELHGKFHITPFDGPSRAVIGGRENGAAYVADPRGYSDDTKKNVHRVTAWDEHAGTVTSGHSPSNGAACVADPRAPERADYTQTKYRVTSFDEPSGAVIGASTTGNGAFAVADPRHGLVAEKRAAFDNSGTYGILPWEGPSGAVSAAGQHDNGRWSAADPRVKEALAVHPSDGWQLPKPEERLVCVIRALDGTWHRPLTTLELAALQSLVDPEEYLVLEGMSDSAWREWIGNAVPPDSAEAVAGVMGRTLLLAWSGETFLLSNEPIWVRNIAVALSLQPQDLPPDLEAAIQ